MTKNYKVNVDFTTIIKQDDEVSKFSLSALGTVLSSTNLDKLSFQSEVNDTLYQLEISIYNNNVIKIKQLKPNQSNLEFDPRQKTYATYLTDYGSLDLEIRTNKLVCKPGAIVIEYLVENADKEKNHYTIELNYKEIT
jgi:uncharacterized beta-barrel protein YwiB (DUF1934 family)